MYLIFSGYFAAEGLIYPFWPTWLASLGFGASQIGLLIAAAYWPQVIAGVALTYVADWRIDQLRLATLLAALAGACALLFHLAEGLPLFIALSVLYGAFWTSVLPLTESYLLKRDKAALQNYGRVRAVGSLAFILTATLGGLLLGRFGQQLVPALVGLTMLLTALAYNAMHVVRTLVERATGRGWGLAQVREQVLKTAARVLVHSRYVTVIVTQAAARIWEGLWRQLARLGKPPPDQATL